MRLLPIALVLLWDAGAPRPAFDPGKASLIRIFDGDAGRACVAAISPDGRVLAAAGKTEITLRSLATGETVRTFPAPGPIDQIRFSGDAHHLLLLSTVDAVLHVLQLSDGAEVCTIKEVDPRIHSFAASPDGKAVAVGAKGGCRIHEIPGGRELRTIPGTCPAFSRDGKRLATFDGEGTWKIWDAALGTVLESAAGKNAGGCSLAFSPDGRRIAASNNWGEIRIDDAKGGKERRRLNHPGFIVLVDWSRDGRWIVSGANDGIVRLWDAAAGREVRKLEAHVGMINSLAFGPDGRSLLTAGADGKVKLWGARALPLEGAVESEVGPAGTGMIGITGADAPGGGVTITSIFPGSAAERYGLEVNDVILEFRGTTMASYGQLANEVLKHGEGEIVTLKVKRGEKDVELKIKLGRR